MTKNQKLMAAAYRRAASAYVRREVTPHFRRKRLGGWPLSYTFVKEDVLEYLMGPGADRILDQALKAAKLQLHYNESAGEFRVCRRKEDIAAQEKRNKAFDAKWSKGRRRKPSKSRKP